MSNPIPTLLPAFLIQHSGVARVFFTIASNTPGPEASQLQTVLVVQPRWSSECKSCAPGDLAAQGYGHYPGTRSVHHSWIVSRRVQIFLKEPSIDKYFEQTSPSVSPGRQLSEANATGRVRKLWYFLSTHRDPCIIVYSITICRGVAWPPNLGRL